MTFLHQKNAVPWDPWHRGGFTSFGALHMALWAALEVSRLEPGFLLNWWGNREKNDGKGIILRQNEASNLKWYHGLPYVWDKGKYANWIQMDSGSSRHHEGFLKVQRHTMATLTLSLRPTPLMKKRPNVCLWIPYGRCLSCWFPCDHVTSLCLVISTVRQTKRPVHRTGPGAPKDFDL